MKTIVAIFLICLFASVALADNPTRFGFKAYSTSTSKTCSIFGMKHNLSGNFQGFAPLASLSRSYVLGTKGYANYSTLNTGAIRFQCVDTGTANIDAVKVQVGGFLNGVESVFLTLDNGIFITQ